MIRIEIRGEIGSYMDEPLIRMAGLEDFACTAEGIRRALDSAPDDPDVLININSCGGLTEEGFTIYDVLRTSGKNIHTNIIGSCHSMAVCILLAAPFENRTANPNARALIHKVRAPGFFMSAEEAMQVAQLITQDEEAILDIYEDRTGQPRDLLEQIMDEEQVRDADFLLAHGFIARINSFNTNSKSKTMAKNTAKPSRWERFLRNAAEAIGARTQTFNYDYTDGDGKVLFWTDGGEDEVLKVGTVVHLPDGEDSGTFLLGDGRRVTIEDNVVTEIKEADAENAARVEELEGLVAEGAAVAEELSNRVTYLEAENRRLSTENSSLRNQVQSQGHPRNRLAAPGNRRAAAPSIEELKNKAREARNVMRGAKPIKK